MAHVIRRLGSASDWLRLVTTCRSVPEVSVVSAALHPKFKLTARRRCNPQHCLRCVHTSPAFNVVYIKERDIEPGGTETIPDIVQNVMDKRIIYSSYVHDRTVKLPYHRRRQLEEKMKAAEERTIRNEAVPLIIEKMVTSCELPDNERNSSAAPFEKTSVSYPYMLTETVNKKVTVTESRLEKESLDFDGSSFSVKEDIACRMHAYTEKKSEFVGNQTYASLTNDNLETTIEESTWSESDNVNSELRDSGTADPNVPVSNVPCGGCGAHLHCQNPALMGNCSCSFQYKQSGI